MGIRFLKMAVVYFTVGVIFGLVIGITQNFGFSSVHAHINLLGWASMALAGIIYHLFPAAGNHALAKAHFWLHAIGVPIMIIGLFWAVSADEEKPIHVIFISTGALLAIIGVILFLINVLRNVKKAA
ncbi:cytochrome-c oxidase [Paenibacillus sp. MBLB4367]|uniref:cytochrome-c oxidase n=1 Tax=Paenibacillus sp. MBLB4367 TaxID=3384767 RepID=UPI0039083BDA